MPQSDARHNCGRKLQTAVFSLPLYPNVVPAPAFSAALSRSYHRKTISHSGGHSVVNRQDKKPIHRDIENRRELCSGFKMMKLCIGFKIQIRSICRLTNHADRDCDIGWCGNYQLPLAFLKSSFILYSVIFYNKLRSVCLPILLGKVSNNSPKIEAYY